MKRTYYVCGMTWNIEMKHNGAPSCLYSSVAELKKAGRCWKSDGIVKMKVEAEYVVGTIGSKKGKK